MKTKLMLIASALAVAALMQPVAAEDTTADQITRSLTPKALTRGINQPAIMTPADAAVIDSMTGLTRSITVEERTALAPVIANTALPQIDLSIEFAFNSAAITPEATVALVQLGTALKSDALAKSVFVFAGHTDSKGSPEYNQKLSDERALAAKAFMVQAFGIDASRIIAAGFGEEQPLNAAYPEAPENRRVTIINVAH